MINKNGLQKKALSLLIVVYMLFLGCVNSNNILGLLQKSPEVKMIGKTFEQVEKEFGPFSMVYIKNDTASYVFQNTTMVFFFDGIDASKIWQAEISNGLTTIPAAIAVMNISSKDVCTGVSGRVKDFGIPDSYFTEKAFSKNDLVFLEKESTLAFQRTDNNSLVVTAICDNNLVISEDAELIIRQEKHIRPTLSLITLASRKTLSAGHFHLVGLKSNGTVMTVGDNPNGQCNVSSWKDIIAVSAAGYHTVGLKSDGTVVAVGNNEDGQCNVSGWTDIVAIAQENWHTVGLKSDGTVVAVGYNEDGQCNVSGWTDIVAIATGAYHTIGLKSDGTVVAVGDNSCGECNVSRWKDIIAISAYGFHTVGLKSDGTVVATGPNAEGECNVSDWKDIVAVATGDCHTIGLKTDGTVVAVGRNTEGECNVSAWKDIVAISAGSYHTIGLKSDGTVVTVGGDEWSQRDVSAWTDIRLPENLKKASSSGDSLFSNMFD